MITITGFMEALKKAGLPASRPSIREFERKKIIAPPKERLGDRGDRVYTKEEVDVRVKQIKSHQEKKYKKS